MSKKFILAVGTFYTCLVFSGVFIPKWSFAGRGVIDLFLLSTFMILLSAKLFLSSNLFFWDFDVIYWLTLILWVYLMAGSAILLIKLPSSSKLTTMDEGTLYLSRFLIVLLLITLNN